MVIHAAFGGSTNLLLHLTAIAHSAGLRRPTVDDWAATIQGLQVASGNKLRAMVGDGPLVTDDRPLPEYFLLRRLTNPDAPQLSLQALRAMVP